MQQQKQNRARVEDRVNLGGVWVSPLGARVYGLLSEGKTMREISEETGVSIGAIGGYMKRARKYGIIKNRKKMDIIAKSLADGKEYHFTSAKQIAANNFSYNSVYRAYTTGKPYCGMTWRTGPQHGPRVNWRGHMVTRRTARFYNECMARDMKFGDITIVGEICGMNQHSALAAYRNLYRWGYVKKIILGFSVIGKSDKLGVVELDSLDDADFAGFSRRAILDCLRGDQKTHAGYTWEKIKHAENR